eukprot:363794-Chlamydomonas_euryale.AAC.6
MGAQTRPGLICGANGCTDPTRPYLGCQWVRRPDQAVITATNQCIRDPLTHRSASERQPLSKGDTTARSQVSNWLCGRPRNRRPRQPRTPLSRRPSEHLRRAQPRVPRTPLSRRPSEHHSRAQPRVPRTPLSRRPSEHQRRATSAHRASSFLRASSLLRCRYTSATADSSAAAFARFSCGVNAVATGVGRGASSTAPRCLLSNCSPLGQEVASLAGLPGGQESPA